MAPYLLTTDRQRQLRRQNLQRIAAGHVILLKAAEELVRLENESKRVRRWSIRPINISRPITSEFSTLVRDFYHVEDGEGFREYFRMDHECLYRLFEMVKDHLARPLTSSRPISPALRLSLTLKVLASGDSMRNTAKSYRIGYSTAFQILYETCDVIWKILQPVHLKFPDTIDEWKSITESFWDYWQFPLCLGSIDGKHVVIKKPAKAGSQFFNYKLDHSVVLLAVADAQYKFIYVDVGGYGRNSDGGIFAASSFGKALIEESTNRLYLPGYGRFPGTDLAAPHVFIGDAAFPLGSHLLKPFGGKKRTREQRIFDYRLSRARRVIENAFGILVSRWRILHQALGCSPENAEKIVKATTILHNFLIKTAADRYAPPRSLDYIDQSGMFQDGAWRHFIPPDAALRRLEKLKSKSSFGKLVRDRFTEFFGSENGSVPWQENFLD